MKIYKSILSLLITLISFSFFSCTDRYDDYNKNITGATEEEMERDQYKLRSYMLTMQNNVVATDVNRNQFVECLLGGSYGGYLADSNDGFNNRNFGAYIPEEHWIQVAFNDIIPAMIPQYGYIKKGTDDPVFLNIAAVIKVMGMHRITDIYGPIPYSKVGVGGQLNAPYDSQEDVYKLMLEELDTAIKVLTDNQTIDITPKADRVYQGNTLKWIKLANSLKLRLAIRISNVSPELAKQKAEEAVSHPVGVIISNDDNAFMQQTGINPFRTVMYNYNDGDSRIGADITSYMNGYADPRREKYFVQSSFASPIVNGYHGLRSGIVIISKVAGVKQYANMNVEDNSKLMWMNAAEVAFLKAEGALRGWSMGATAESLYNEGIRLSFDQWGASGADAYMANASNTPQVYTDPLGLNSYTGTPSTVTIKWDETAGREQKLEKIITQKWIANFPLGIEAWSEFRRTGYPKLMEVKVNNSGNVVDSKRMARRLPYPQMEYEGNSANVNAAVSQYLRGADNMATDVWWAKKN